MDTVIDLNIRKPHLSEPTMKRILKELGYPENLDNILLFLCGSYYAQVLQKSKTLHGVARTEDEQGAIKHMAHRMIEIKEAYLEQRFDLE